tara:strand:- start:12682 stop:12936 length:255 start_codon:yes stop_codon:yes gene_type:complete
LSDVKVIFDKDCPPDHTYMRGDKLVMNIKHQAGFGDDDEDLSKAEQALNVIGDQKHDAFDSFINFHGNMATNNRRKLGVITGIK